MKWGSFCLLCLLLSDCANKATTFPVTEDDEYGVYEAMLERDNTPVSDELLRDPLLYEPTSDLPSVFNSEALAAFQAAQPTPGQRIKRERLHAGPSDGGSARKVGLIKFDSTGRFAVSGMTFMMGSHELLYLVAAERTVDGHWGVTALKWVGGRKRHDADHQEDRRP